MKTFETEVVEKGVQDFKCSKNTIIAIRSTKEDPKHVHKRAFYKLSAPHFRTEHMANIPEGKEESEHEADKTKYNHPLFHSFGKFQYSSDTRLCQYEFNEKFLVWILRKKIRRTGLIESWSGLEARDTLMITNLMTRQTIKIKEWDTIYKMEYPAELIGKGELRYEKIFVDFERSGIRIYRIFDATIIGDIDIPYSELYSFTKGRDLQKGAIF